MSTREPYFRPVEVSEIKRHGDYAFEYPTHATVLRITNFRSNMTIPVATCTDPVGFKEFSGKEHNPDMYIRSMLMLFDRSFKYDVEIVDWYQENDVCRTACLHNEALDDYDMTYDYDDHKDTMFTYDPTHHYDYTLPDELLAVIPVDLNESQYYALPERSMKLLLNHLAYRWLVTMLPISDIRIV